MSFRVIPADSSISSIFNSSSDSKIGLIFLDDEFNPIDKPQIVILEEDPCTPVRSEDARLVKVADKLYLIYSDNRDPFVSHKGFRMYVSELKMEDGQFTIVNTDRILHFEGENCFRREKNWVPFDYKGNLLLAYSLYPHHILFPISHTSLALSLTSTYSCIDWPYGELRGGTPALLDNCEYLGFFHSSKNMATVHSNGIVMPHYFMGAYTFNHEPPFEITKISPEPIICKGFYEGEYYEPYWHPVRVIFPCGFIFDHHHIYISYGRQDHEIWVMKIDRCKLKNSLIPVETYTIK